MRKILIITVIAAIFAPAALAVEPQAKNASDQCKALKASMPAGEFTKLYKSHGACVAKHDAQAAAATKNAAVACKAEQDMPEADFKAAHGDKTFVQFYAGDSQKANDKGKGQPVDNAAALKNAHGKCVSAKASEKTASQQAAELSAAKTCKAWAKAPTATQDALAKADATKGTFEARYGKKANAYGKCVADQTKVIAAARAQA